jgi:hypothetical protein
MGRLIKQNPNKGVLFGLDFFRYRFFLPAGFDQDHGALRKRSWRLGFTYSSHWGWLRLDLGLDFSQFSCVCPNPNHARRFEDLLQWLFFEWGESHLG